MAAFDGAFKDGKEFDEEVKLLGIDMGTEELNPFTGAIGTSEQCWTRRESMTSILYDPAPLTNG